MVIFGFLPGVTCQARYFVEAFLFGRPEVFVNFAAKKIDEKTGELTDEPTKDIIRHQLAGFAKFIRRVKA